MDLGQSYGLFYRLRIDLAKFTDVNDLVATNFHDLVASPLQCPQYRKGFPCTLFPLVAQKYLDVVLYPLYYGSAWY